MAVPPPPKIDFVDRPELIETFVDSIRNVTFDGATIRAELCVTRFEEAAQPAAAASAKQVPACRLVLRPDAAVDLFVRLQRLIALMEQRGIVRREQPKPQPDKPADALENPLGSGSKRADPKH
jgi:hypothetical protein